MAGMSALALVCLCLLYIIFLTIPAHASTGSGFSALIPLDTGTPVSTDTSTPSPTVTNTPSPTDTTTPSPTVTNTPSPTDTTTPSPTATSTPSPTATNTPSPTVTTNPTMTPGASPSATRPVFPSPTTRATVGATTSPAAATSPGASPTTGATPTDTSAAGVNQGPGGSSTPGNTNDSSNSGDNPLANALLIILFGGGVTGLLALLFIGVRIFLRTRLVPLPSPKLPPSGAAPWSRSPANVQAQPDQSSVYVPLGDNPFQMPDGNAAPFSGGFNAAPTAAWNASAAPSGPFAPATPPPFPGVQVGLTGQQPGPAAGSAPPGYVSGETSQPGDLNSAARIRLRRAMLHTSGDYTISGGQIPDNVSADMMVVSDPYLQAKLNQQNQNGQQAPGEFSEGW